MTKFEFVEELPGAEDHIGRAASPLPLLIEFAAALKTNPGVWAKYPIPVKMAYTVAWRINTQTDPAIAFRGDPGFEAATRKKVLYVRWVKPAPPPRRRTNKSEGNKK